MLKETAREILMLQEQMQSCTDDKCSERDWQRLNDKFDYQVKMALYQFITDEARITMGLKPIYRNG